MSFYLIASDAATLSLSTDSDPANLVELVAHSEKKTSADPGSPHSSPVSLVAGQLYYLEATHVQVQSKLIVKNSFVVPQ